MRSFFNPYVNNIIKLAENNRHADTKVLYVVLRCFGDLLAFNSTLSSRGGFAESKYVFEKIEEHFQPYVEVRKSPFSTSEWLPQVFD